MSGIGRAWRNWKHGRKFAKKGKGCRFIGRFIDIDGHVELGDYCRFRDNINIRVRGDGKVIIGDRCVISWNVIIECVERIEIHDNAGIGEFVRIRDSVHQIYGTEYSWRYTPIIVRPVVIGEETFIGSGAYISLGVTIGKGAVVGVGSLVTKDIPAYEVWAGTPARFIRHRLKDLPPEIEAQSAQLLKEQGIRKERRTW